MIVRIVLFSKCALKTKYPRSVPVSFLTLKDVVANAERTLFDCFPVKSGPSFSVLVIKTKLKPPICLKAWNGWPCPEFWYPFSGIFYSPFSGFPNSTQGHYALFVTAYRSGLFCDSCNRKEISVRNCHMQNAFFIFCYQITYFIENTSLFVPHFRANSTIGLFVI